MDLIRPFKSGITINTRVNTTSSRYLAIAKSAAMEAGKALMTIFQTGGNRVLKQNGFPTTISDKVSAKIIEEILAKTGLPIISEESPILSLEEKKGRKYYWLVDPLDGTKEYISHSREFTVNIALMQDNKPVAGVIYVPAREITYYGSSTGVYKSCKGKTVRLQALKRRLTADEITGKIGVRVVVSIEHFTEATADFLRQLKRPVVQQMGSALKFMMLAEDLADVYPRFECSMEWDTAAAHVLLNALNRGIYILPEMKAEASYNKPDLKNPWLIAF